MLFCNSCGAQVDPGVSYCPSCGAPIAMTPGVPGTTLTTVPEAQLPNPSSPYDANDRMVLKKVRLFAIVMLVALVAAFAISAATNLLTLSSLTSHSGSGSAISSLTRTALRNALSVAGVTLVIDVALSFAAFFQLRSAFKTLAGLDQPKFGMPSKLITLLMISEPVLLVGVLIVFAGISSSFASIVGASAASNSPDMLAGSLVSVAAGGIIVLVAGIAALVGFIGGLMLGLWRVGVRYHSDTIKAGSIFAIIPLLDILSPILVMVGVSSASMNLEATGKP